MASIAELKARRQALSASRASGVARVSYDGRSVDYRSLAEIDRAIEALDRRLLPRAGRYAYWEAVRDLRRRAGAIGISECDHRLRG
jgi:hypothetical protein